MTKIVLYPWMSSMPLAKCDISTEVSGLLTGSTFLPWRSIINVPEPVIIELFEEMCSGNLSFQFKENWNDRCPGGVLEHIELWNS